MKRMNKVGKWKAIAIDWHVTLVYNTQEWCERTRPLWRASLPSRFFYLTQWFRSTEKVEFYRWNNRFAEQVQDLHSLFDHFFCVHCLVSKTLDKLNISRNSTGKEQEKKKTNKKKPTADWASFIRYFQRKILLVSRTRVSTFTEATRRWQSIFRHQKIASHFSF